MKTIEKATDLIPMLDQEALLMDKFNEFGVLDLSERESECVVHNFSVAAHKWMVLKGQLEKAEQRIRILARG